VDSRRVCFRKANLMIMPVRVSMLINLLLEVLPGPMKAVSRVAGLAEVAI